MEINSKILKDNKLIKHYSYKLATNFLRIPISFALQAIFPRILNQSDYGNFDFLTDFSNKVISFLDNGTSTAFYSKLSQNNNDKKLVKFYTYFLFIISLIYIFFTFLSTYFNFSNFIFPDQKETFIIISCFLGIFTLYSNTLLKMVDAYDLTIQGEKFRMIQLIFSVVLFFSTYYFLNKINLLTFFGIQFVVILFLITCSILLIKKKYHLFTNSENLNKTEIIGYSKDFWAFSNPLILYSSIAMFSGIFDRWILQKYGGSIQQAYLGISLKIGAFIFLFSSAMIPLLMREFSKLFVSSRIEFISEMFLKNVKILFFISTFLSVFVSLNSFLITQMLTGGNLYDKAVIVVTIMSFYPIHQTLGQMNSTLFFSTNRTKEYRNIGIIFLPIGTLLCFFFIGPKEYYCLELGAKGLAFYMIIFQFFSVNASLFLNCRYLKISYKQILLFQLKVLFFLIIIGLLIKYIISIFITNLFLVTVLHLLFFLLFIIIFIFNIPQFIGVSKESLNEILILFKIKKS